MTGMMAYSLLSRWSGALGVCAIIAIVRPAHADPRAVVELFTSQGCSSCPPADRILGELAKDPSIIALSMPIDYWDYLGWKDTLADARFSARQQAYSRVRGDREVWICSISKAIPISILRGENGGRELTYYNVVRNLVKVGDWNGTSGSWNVPLESVLHEGVDAAAVYVQDGSRERPGMMLGAAYATLH